MRLMEVSAPTDGFAPSWADDPRSSIAILKIAITACYRGSADVGENEIGVVYHRALRDRRGIGFGAPGLRRLQEGFPLSSGGCL